MDTSTLSRSSSEQLIRLVRSADEPLGLFFRPSRIDHRLLCQLLSEGKTAMTGVVFDPCLMKVQEELHSEILRKKLHAVLDTQAMELATRNGFTKQRAELKWAASKPHVPSDLVGAGGDRFVREIVEFCAPHKFSVALAPAHYLENGAESPWFDIDRRLTKSLRVQLDAWGCSDTSIYYPLAISTKSFYDDSQRRQLKAALKELPIDGVWLRVHPFGSHSSHLTLQRYIAASQDLHDLELPLIAEKTGNVGLALLAFGAVSGLECGVSSGERFDFKRLVREVKESDDEEERRFAAHARVYLSTLGIFLSRTDAKAFFENRSLRAQHGCSNEACCRRGPQDTVSNPRRHFVLTRMNEIGALSRTPSDIRPGEYMEQILRPATDRLGRAIQGSVTGKIQEKIEKERIKLDGWRQTLGEMSRAGLLSHPPLPSRFIHRVRRGA